MPLEGNQKEESAMDAYAVIETGGKQYRVQKDDELRVERLDAEAGATIELDRVLAVSDGENLQVGTPTVADAQVTATVVECVRGDKVVNFKKKRRKGYTRKIGHRQELMVLKIDAVQ